MRSLRQRVTAFLTDESGPTPIEYAVMLALIMVVCLWSIHWLSRPVRWNYSRVGQSIGVSVLGGT